jgi:hypothetical protein
MKPKKKEVNTSQEVEKAKMLLEMTGCVNILDGRDIKKSIRGYSTMLARKNTERNRLEISMNDFIANGGKIKQCPYYEPENK